MARVYTAAQIATHALRQVQIASPYDTAASDPHLSIALDRLAMLVEELAGTEGINFYVPANDTVTLVSGQTDYLLNSLLSPTLDFYNRAYVSGSGVSDDQEVELIRKDEYFKIPDKTVSGIPTLAMIAHDSNHTMSLWPVPGAGLTLTIQGQTFPPDTVANKGTANPGFPAAWNRYFVYALAADIGDGPVARLSDSLVTRWRALAHHHLVDLRAYNGREFVTRPRATAYRDF